jgi:hypothetical protein
MNAIKWAANKEEAYIKGIGYQQRYRETPLYKKEMRQVRPRHYRPDIRPHIGSTVGTDAANIILERRGSPFRVKDEPAPWYSATNALNQDYLGQFGYNYYDAQNGSLPSYITKRPEAGTAVRPATPGPRAPDEGGTPFAGYTKSGWAMQPSDTPWWQPCPMGYKRSKFPPFKCVDELYYGGVLEGKEITFKNWATLGLSLLVIVIGIEVAVHYIRKWEAKKGDKK